MSRSGSWAIGAMLALSAPKPNHATSVPAPTATTRSRMPRTFHATNRPLDTSPGVRASATAKTAAVAPIAMSPRHTYGEILQSPEGIPTNILADRLARLEHAGIITSEAYQDRPVRYAYSLTKPS